MVKNLSCVSCAALNVFPINSLLALLKVQPNLYKLAFIPDLIYTEFKI